MIVLHKGVPSPLLTNTVEYYLIHFALEPLAQPNPTLFVSEDTYVLEKNNVRIEAFVFKPNDSDRILLKNIRVFEKEDIKLTLVQKLLKLLRVNTKQIKPIDEIQKLVVDTLSEEEVDLLRSGKLLRVFR